VLALMTANERDGDDDAVNGTTEGRRRGSKPRIR